MGETPNPYEPGDDCNICWGVGKKWGDYPTPKHVNITFAGLVGICADANQTFVATQDPVNPCLFNFNDGTWGGFWNAPGGVHAISLVHLAPFWNCFSQLGDACQTHFESNGRTADIS